MKAPARTHEPAKIGIRQVKAALKQFEAGLRSITGVRGVGITGSATSGGEALAVYVASRSSASLSDIPDHVEIRSKGESLRVPVRIVEIGKVSAQPA